MTGHILTRWDPTPIHCYPDKPGGECFRCSRHRLGEPPTKAASIDAMTLGKAPCPMWLSRTPHPSRAPAFQVAP